MSRTSNRRKIVPREIFCADAKIHVDFPAGVGIVSSWQALQDSVIHPRRSESSGRTHRTQFRPTDSGFVIFAARIGDIPNSLRSRVVVADESGWAVSMSRFFPEKG
jgi:hypothetical protein